MATLKEAIQKAKLEPDSPKSQQLLKYLSEGKFDSQAAAEGIDLSKFKTSFQSRSNPIQQSSTDQRSVAERQGFMDKLSNYVQQNGQPTQSQPKYDVFKTDNPDPGSVAMINAAQRKETDDPNRGLFDRAVNTVKKTGEAIWEGAGSAQEGAEMIRGSDVSKGIAENYRNKTQKEFDEGRIDLVTYQRKMAKAKDIEQQAAGQASEGFSKQVAGGARVYGSVAEGILMGGLGPETEKVMNFAAEKIGDSEKATEFVSKLGQLAEEHPAMANYLMAITEVAGVKGGTKLAKKAGEGAIDTAKKVTPMVTDAVKKAGDSAMLTNAIKKTQDFASNAGQKLEKTLGSNMLPDEFVDMKAVKKIQEMVTPDLNKKEVQQALLEGRLTRGGQGFFSGKAPDNIDVAKNVKKASETIAKNIPDVKKLNDVKLHARLGDAISELSEKLKPQFEKIQLKPEIIQKANDAWNKAKKMQLDDPILQSFPGLKTAQKNFENVLGSITKPFRAPDGKFRYRNLNDLWDKAKEYDKTVKSAIKEASKVNSEAAQLYQQVWMQNREILRDFLRTEAERMGVNAKKMFGEMNDYYTVQNEIFRLIKGQKGAEGRLKKAGKIVGASVLGATAYGVGSSLLKD